MVRDRGECIHLHPLSCVAVMFSSCVCGWRGPVFYVWDDGVVVRRTVHRLGVQWCTSLVQLNYRKYKFSLID